MKPLPAQQSADDRTSGETIPSLPTAIPTASGSYSVANRRISPCPVQRAYPWLLAASTAVAALFCLMYITKPVIMPATPAIQPSIAKPVPATSGTKPAPTSLMPSQNRLPGEIDLAATTFKPTPSDPRHALPPPSSTSAFEETNIRIQHILTAEAPGGHLDRIDIDVPVLYQSRNLRWTTEEVTEARALLIRLMNYQEKSRALRAEGVELLESWNRLIGNSIPSIDLRADSPSLPANQEDAADSPRPAGLITTESIQLQPSGK